MVEREQSQRRKEELFRAREVWKKEKQQFFQDAHQNQLRAIARQTAILEDKLKREFQEHLDKLGHENREHLERTIQNTWEEARQVEDKAVANARMEEQYLAKEEAKKVANMVAQERRKDKELADNEKARALEDHTKYMEGLCRQALAQQQSDLEKQSAAKMKEMNDECKLRLAEVEQQLIEQAADNEKLRTDLQEMAESRDNWELQYRNLKMEFSDFIDQFPGFRAEFILK